LFTAGDYKIERPAEALAEGDPPSLKLRKGAQFCATFSGQNWYRIRLIDTQNYSVKDGVVLC